MAAIRAVEAAEVHDLCGPMPIRKIAVGCTLAGLGVAFSAKWLTWIALANPVTHFQPSKTVLSAIFSSKVMASTISWAPPVAVGATVVLALLAWSSAGLVAAGPLQRRSAYAAVSVILLVEMPLLVGLGVALFATVITVAVIAVVFAMAAALAVAAMVMLLAGCLEAL
jgi:hypothetical protein